MCILRSETIYYEINTKNWATKEGNSCTCGCDHKIMQWKWWWWERNRKKERAETGKSCEIKQCEYTQTQPHTRHKFIHMCKHKGNSHVPEVLERCVDFKAPAVDVSNIGSSQFHFSDSQASFIVLNRKVRWRSTHLMTINREVVAVQLL